MDIRPDKLKLLELVEKAQQGKIALPQFQRNFVWPRDDIADLLLSILKGYFIGSFLLLRSDTDDTPFAVRPIAGVEIPISHLRPEWLILDGQQRLTSLHYVLEAPDVPLKYTKNPYRFFLDLGKLLDGDEDSLIYSLRADQCEEYQDREYQFKNWVLPFTELPRWTAWKDAYEDWLFDTDRDEHQRYREERRAKWNAALETLTDFRVPILEIPKVQENDADGIAEVCAIFEKMNSTGVRLSVFDLLTARLYKHGIDLHALWEQAISDHPQMEEFSGGETDMYGVFALRVIALLRRQELRSKALINLSPEGFEDDWARAVNAIEKALERIIAVNPDGFGVFDPRWQPYSTLVPALAALLERADADHLGHQAYLDIKCWYWGSVFLERYAGAVESTTYRDAMDLLKRQDDASHDPEVFADIRRGILENAGFSLRSVARINSVYRGVMNLVAINGARDFQNNDGISFHDLEDHHIFPQAYLRDEFGLKGDAVNTILNKTLITAGANRKISRKSPSQYLQDVIPDEHRDQILRSHLIGPEAQAAMEQNDYEGFLKAREQDILQFLKSYLEPAK